MNEVRKIAQQNANKSPEQNGNEYNKTLHGNHLVIRDRVLLRNFSEREGTGKLRAHRRNTIYVVVGKEDNLPVYNIKPENSEGTSRKKFIATSSCLNHNFFPSTPKINNNKNCNKISQDKRIQPDSNVKGDNCDNGSETIILKRQLYENYSHSSTVPEVNQS